MLCCFCEKTEAWVRVFQSEPCLCRLLESTFRLDVKAARDYCEADERWLNAVAFLDNDGGAGWDLLGAMLRPEWRQRPTAESCLNHPFLKEDPS